MITWRAGALLLAPLLAGVSSVVHAQDSGASRSLLLSVDPSKLSPVYRLYDVIVHRADSAVVIGRRTVAMMPGNYGGVPAWELVETRTGVVPAADSLWLFMDARPLYWSSALGAGRLTGQFVNDSLFGMVAIGRSSRNIVLPLPRNVLATAGMTEVLLSLLHVDEAWTDSAAVLEIEPLKAHVLPAELIVVARESYGLEIDPARPAWVIALRTADRQVLYWLDQETGLPVRIQENLPQHVGSLIEYRMRLIPPLRFPLFWPAR